MKFISRHFLPANQARTNLPKNLRPVRRRRFRALPQVALRSRRGSGISEDFEVLFDDDLIVR